jgi:hypothetical protein
MLRAKVRAFASDKRFRPVIKVMTRVLHIVGLLWIVSFPYMSRNVFTSENALTSNRLATKFDTQSSAFSTFARIRFELEQISPMNY